MTTSTHRPVPVHLRLLRYLLRLVINLAITLVWYVFSIGPMFWYWYEAHYMGGSAFIDKLYSPLVEACEKSEFIRDWVNHYINWWIVGPDEGSMGR